MKTQIKTDGLYWASFNRFELRIQGDAVCDICQQGANDEAVAYWTPKVRALAEEDNFPNKPTPDAIRAELKEYGAWDADELADDDANWRRLVWSAAWNIAEDDEPSCDEPLASGGAK